MTLQCVGAQQAPLTAEQAYRFWFLQGSISAKESLRTQRYMCINIGCVCTFVQQPNRRSTKHFLNCVQPRLEVLCDLTGDQNDLQA